VLINPLQPASGLTRSPISRTAFISKTRFAARQTSISTGSPTSTRKATRSRHAIAHAVRAAEHPADGPGVSTTISTLLNIVEGKYAYAPVDTASTGAARLVAKFEIDAVISSRPSGRGSTKVPSDR